MKTYQFSLSVIAIQAMLMFTGCSEQKAETTDLIEMSDSLAINGATTSLEPFEKRKFIKTADLRFKVKNVQDATNKIEDIAEKYEGFITEAELLTNVIKTNEVEISEDSVLHNKAYEITNQITMRIPNQYFDKVLREIQPVMTFVERKRIAADDVSFSLIASDLRKKRFSKFENRFEKEIEQKSKKLVETTASEEKLLDYQTQADNNKVQTMSLNDQVNYSTLTVELYQPVTNTVEMLPNMENPFAYQPNLFLRIWQSVRTGWFLFEEVLIFVTKLWMFMLLALCGYWLYKVYFKTSKV